MPSWHSASMETRWFRLDRFRQGERGQEVAWAIKVDRIRQQVQQLKATDQLRRELVANVSHDLRMPVTSLQG